MTLDAALAANPDNVEPRTFAEAMKHPDADQWHQAAVQEIQALIEHGTFDVVDLPPDRKAIGSHCVFKIKRNSDGFIEQYKGRLVAKGFSQHPGFDYTDTFAPTPKWATLRAILALGALHDFEMHSVDISSAFLNGDMDAEVYLDPAEEFPEAPGKVWKLLKPLYGLKQSSRQWHKKLDAALSLIGFTQVQCNHSIWVWHKDEQHIIVPVFVDDMTIVANSPAAIQQVISDLRTHFKLRDLGPTTFLLGVQIDRNCSTRSISISQHQYPLDILTCFGFEDCNPLSTPMEEGLRLSKDMAPQNDKDHYFMKDKPYSAATGALQWLAIVTHPDIAYVIGVLCRFNSNPGPAH